MTSTREQIYIDLLRIILERHGMSVIDLDDEVSLYDENCNLLYVNNYRDEGKSVEAKEITVRGSDRRVKYSAAQRPYPRRSGIERRGKLAREKDQ